MRLSTAICKIVDKSFGKTFHSVNNDIRSVWMCAGNHTKKIHHLNAIKHRVKLASALQQRGRSSDTNESLSENQRRVENVLSEYLAEADGFEWWKFRVGSYNKIANHRIRLPYDDDAMAVLVLNNPYFFEGAFKQWLIGKRNQSHGSFEQFAKQMGTSPIRDFFLCRFEQIEKALLPIVTKSICDFEPVIHRPPAVSLPLCGQVSGAAYFYKPNVVLNPETNEPKSRMGLALHAKYGGHFGLRGVIIFPNTQLPIGFSEQLPVRTLETDEEIDYALELINEHWRDNRYRDCGNPIVRYSDLQLQYFNTMPRHRWKLIAHWFN